MKEGISPALADFRAQWKREHSDKQKAVTIEMVLFDQLFDYAIAQETAHQNELLLKKAEAEGLLSQLLDVQEDCIRLEALINTPETEDFLKAVKLEAAHQVERWGDDDRAKKNDADWLWLVCYLAGKAIFGKDGHGRSSRGTARILADALQMHAIANGADIPLETDGREKYLHRIITVAAAALNWHRNRWPGRAPG